MLNVSALTTVTQTGGWTLYAQNGGEVKLSALTSLTGSQGITFNDTNSSTLLDSSLATLSGVSVSTDGTDSQLFNAWTSFINSTLSLTGGTMSMPDLTDLDGSHLNLSNAASLGLTTATSVAFNNSVSVSGGAVTLTSAATFNGATVVVSNAGSLIVPAGSTYAGTTTLEATGGSCVLDLGDTTLVESTSIGSFLSIEALSGGDVDLASLTSVSGGYVLLESTGTGSVINLSALTSFTSTGGAEVSNGGSIQTGITLPTAPDIWIGSSGNWDTGSNWILGTSPTSSNAVVINTAASATVSLGFFENFTVNNLTLGSNDTLQFSDDSTLTTTGNFSNSGALNLVPGGQLQVGGNMTDASTAALNEQIEGTSKVQFRHPRPSPVRWPCRRCPQSLLVNGFLPVVGNNFQIITFASHTGSFTTTSGLQQQGQTFTVTPNSTSLNLVVNPTPPSFTADSPPAAGVGSFYSYQFQANGTAPITFTATNLPAWATLNPNTGVLSGTPPAVATVNSIVVTATNAINPPANVTISLVAQLEPPVFTADTPPVAIGGSPYSYQFGHEAPATRPSPIPSLGSSPGPTLTPTAVSPARRTRTGTLTSAPASNGINPATTVPITLTVAAWNCGIIHGSRQHHLHYPQRYYAAWARPSMSANATLNIDAKTFLAGAIFNMAAGSVANINSSPIFQARSPARHRLRQRRQRPALHRRRRPDPQLRRQHVPVVQRSNGPRPRRSHQPRHHEHQRQWRQRFLQRRHPR